MSAPTLGETARPSLYPLLIAPVNSEPKERLPNSLTRKPLGTGPSSKGIPVTSIQKCSSDHHTSFIISGLVTNLANKPAHMLWLQVTLSLREKKSKSSLRIFKRLGGATDDSEHSAEKRVEGILREQEGRGGGGEEIGETRGGVGREEGKSIGVGEGKGGRERRKEEGRSGRRRGRGGEGGLDS